MRYLYLSIFLLILGLPIVLRHVMLGGERQSAAPGSLRLVVVTPHTGDIRREYARAFDQWYRQHYGQGVDVDYRVPGGTSDMVRLLTSTYDAYRRPDGSLPLDVPVDFDVIWGGGDYTFYHQLQPAGILQPIHVDEALLHEAFPTDSLAGVRLYDATSAPSGAPAPQWIGVCLSSFGIIYNPQLYQALRLSPPRQWGDLTNQRLFGFIALADPSHSGSAAVAYMMVIQRAMADAEQQFLDDHPKLKRIARRELEKQPAYQRAIAQGWHRGMGQLVLIAANARYFTDSSPVVPTDVGRGEAAAGMAIDFYARMTEQTVGARRARFVLPRAATAITPDPVAIATGVRGQRLTLATRFVEFLLTPAAQRLWILKPGQPGGPVERSPMRMPIRRDVYADQRGWADHFNPFEEAGGFNQRGQWMALMSDTMPFWNAAWIDSRDTLINACQMIHKINDPARAAKLLDDLADLPLAMHDVQEYRDERIRLTQSRLDVDEWRTRERLKWGERFREHYQHVAAEAR